MLTTKFRTALKNWLFDLLVEEFRAWLATHEQAKRWTFARCFRCGRPLPYEEVLFCCWCGTPLVQGEEYTTEPVRALERPFLAYVHHQHPNPGPHTTKHRTIKLQRREEHHQ